MITLAFLATVTAVVAALVLLVAIAAHRARKPFPRVALVGLAGWLAVTGVLAGAGVTELDGGFPRAMLLAILATTVLIVVAHRSRIADHLSPAHVIALQLFRLPVELVLWRLYVDGSIPIQMTFEGRNFDVLVALTAIPVAILVARSASKRVVLGWHLFGLAMLVNIVVTAMLSTPGPLRVFMTEPANVIVGELPFIWLPALLVPIAFASHVVGIRQALKR